MKPSRPEVVDALGDTKSRVRILEAATPPEFGGIEVKDAGADDFTDVLVVEFDGAGWATAAVSQPDGPGTATVTVDVPPPATDFLTGAAYSSGYGGALPFSHDFGSSLLDLTQVQIPTYATDHDTVASLALSVANSDASLTPGDIIVIQFSIFRSGPIFYADGKAQATVDGSGNVFICWSSGAILLDEGPGPSGYVYSIEANTNSLAHAAHLIINRATFTAI
jgi:hypothetical protein